MGIPRIAPDHHVGIIKYIVLGDFEAHFEIEDEDLARFALVSLKRFIYYWSGQPKASNSVVASYFSNSLFLASSWTRSWSCGTSR